MKSTSAVRRYPAPVWPKQLLLVNPPAETPSAQGSSPALSPARPLFHRPASFPPFAQPSHHAALAGSSGWELGMLMLADLAEWGKCVLIKLEPRHCLATQIGIRPDSNIKHETLDGDSGGLIEPRRGILHLELLWALESALMAAASSSRLSSGLSLNPGLDPGTG